MRRQQDAPHAAGLRAPTWRRVYGVPPSSWPRALLVAALAALALLPGGAVAHEGKTIGRYQVVVGWESEPALEGETNAIMLWVKEQETGRPVEGVEQTVQVQLRFGEARSTKTLDAVLGDPGLYRVNVIPTRPGRYEVALRGTMGRERVDEVIPLDRVEGATELQFPERVPSSRETAGVVRAVQESAAAAQRAASLARTLALVGLGAGLLGVALGGAAVVLRRR